MLQLFDVVNACVDDFKLKMKNWLSSKTNLTSLRSFFASMRTRSKRHILPKV